MRIIKVCGVCGKEFVASKMTSKYCSRRCERVAFRKRESEKKKNEKESAEALREEEKIKSLREKAFLTPKDVGVLFGVSRATVYRYFQTGIVKAIKIRNKTFVRTSDLDKMFDEASPYKKRKYQIKEEQEYYTLREIMEKYQVAKPYGDVVTVWVFQKFMKVVTPFSVKRLLMLSLQIFLKKSISTTTIQWIR